MSLLVLLSGERMNPVEKVNSFISDARRIFVVSKKPTMDEYKRMLAIVGLGIVVIGVIAFTIYLVFILLKLQ